VAPIRPHTFSDFIISPDHFDTNSGQYKKLIDDIVIGAKTFGATGLYPKGKKINDLPFRNNFYRWIGKIHLDHRSGMSYGFLAKQMPAQLSSLIPLETAKKKFPEITDSKDYFFSGDKLFIIIKISGSKFCMQVPPVWVLSQKSGADKTNVTPQSDILKLGLINGKMYMETPREMKLTKDYRPSFDTKVILAHAVGNAIVASILMHFDKQADFVKRATQDGIALAHWHGYFQPENIPKGWYYYGQRNPHVACSTAQSAIFALDGKLRMFEQVSNDHQEYKGDIHIEPHHGTNISFTSITELAELLKNNPSLSVLGNKYLPLYV
jgi:hypothetical protein